MPLSRSRRRHAPPALGPGRVFPVRGCVLLALLPLLPLLLVPLVPGDCFAGCVLLLEVAAAIALLMLPVRSAGTAGGDRAGTE